FGLSRSDQNAAFLSTKREYVAGADQVFRSHVVADGGEDRMSPVCGAYARRYPFSRLDGYGERGLKRRLVPGDHHGEVKPIHHFSRKRKADQATPISGHEIYRLRCRFLRRNAQIALIFPIFVIYQDYGLSEHY